jgi:hypothetical protein
VIKRGQMGGCRQGASKSLDMYPYRDEGGSVCGGNEVHEQTGGVRSNRWWDSMKSRGLVIKTNVFLKWGADEDRPGRSVLILGTLREGGVYTETRVRKSRR